MKITVSMMLLLAAAVAGPSMSCFAGDAGGGEAEKVVTYPSEPKMIYLPEEGNPKMIYLTEGKSSPGVTHTDPYGMTYDMEGECLTGFEYSCRHPKQLTK